MSFGDEAATGLMSVSGTEVRPLFRPFGEAARKVHVKQARPAKAQAWLKITEPARGVRLSAADILITAREIDRFEDAHGIGRTRSAGPGAPGRYDWDGFYVAVMKRIHERGFPARQSDLIAEMQEWFIAHSADGVAPDESTM